MIIMMHYDFYDFLTTNETNLYIYNLTKYNVQFRLVALVMRIPTHSFISTYVKTHFNNC